MSALVEAINLRKCFASKGAVVPAVDGVSLAIAPGETLGIVGESGCGKSTLGRLLLRLIEPTSGAVRFDGADLTHMSASELRRMRRRFQMVFQDPHASLNPRMTVQRILEEPLRTHGMPAGMRRRRVNELMDAVGLPTQSLNKYAHAFSGGQRQRIGIARALALNPAFIVADEPVAALDVSIQAQVLNLMADLKRDFDLTYLFISHDLSVVEYISTRVGVMYMGRLVELAPADQLYRDPLHPYTRMLFESIPVPDPEHKTIGSTPATANGPGDLCARRGCAFHARCPLAHDRCRVEEPEWREVKPGRFVACHLHDVSELE